jgi:hypothetical protein
MARSQDDPVRSCRHGRRVSPERESHSARIRAPRISGSRGSAAGRERPRSTTPTCRFICFLVTEPRNDSITRSERRPTRRSVAIPLPHRAPATGPPSRHSTSSWSPHRVLTDSPRRRLLDHRPYDTSARQAASCHARGAAPVWVPPAGSCAGLVSLVPWRNVSDGGHECRFGLVERRSRSRW